jgi:Na+/glutamate symporter
LKTGVILGLGLFIAWALLALVQLWFAPLSAELFVKLTISAAVVETVVIIVTLVLREYRSEKELKSKGYLD